MRRIGRITHRGKNLYGHFYVRQQPCCRDRRHLWRRFLTINRLSALLARCLLLDRSLHLLVSSRDFKMRWVHRA